jgi:hypothetical protein
MLIHQLTRSQKIDLNRWLRFQWQGQTSFYKKYLQNIIDLEDLKCCSVNKQEKIIKFFFEVGDMEVLKKYRKPHKNRNNGRR